NLPSTTNGRRKQEWSVSGYAINLHSHICVVSRPRIGNVIGDELQLAFRRRTRTAVSAIHERKIRNGVVSHSSVSRGTNRNGVLRPEWKDRRAIGKGDRRPPSGNDAVVTRVYQLQDIGRRASRGGGMTDFEGRLSNVCPSGGREQSPQCRPSRSQRVEARDG